MIEDKNIPEEKENKSTKSDDKPTPDPLVGAVNTYLSSFTVEGSEEEKAIAQANLGRVMSRDMHLVNGDYLTDDLKKANQEAWLNLSEATDKARNFYQKFDELNKLKLELENTDVSKFLFYSDDDKYNKKIEKYNTDSKSLQAERAMFDEVSNELIFLSQSLLTKDKSVNEIEFNINFDTYDLENGVEFRSNGSLAEFDQAKDRFASSVNKKTAMSYYSTDDYLNFNLGRINNDFKFKTSHIFSTILEKSFARLNAKTVSDIDVKNPANLESLVLGILNFTSKSTAKTSGVDLSAIKTELDNAGNLAEKNNIMLTHKDDLQKVMQNMQPVELRKLYESTSDLFNDPYYFKDNQQDFFYNNVPLEIKDIDQYETIISDMDKQAHVQYQSKVIVDYEAKLNYLSLPKDARPEDFKVPSPMESYELFMNKYFVENLYNEDGSKNSLDQIMKKFESEFNEEISLSRESFRNPDFSNLSFMETGYGGGRLQTAEDLINYEILQSDDKIRTVDDKKLQKELKRLQKKYEKSPLPDDIIYFAEKDDEGNLYYATEVVNRDDEGKVIDSRGGVPITNSTDVKRIQNSLRTKDEIEQLIEDDLREYEFRTAGEQAPGKAEDLIKNAAIDVFAAAQENMYTGEAGMDYEDQLKQKEFGFWDNFQLAWNIGTQTVITPKAWFDPAERNLLTASEIEKFGRSRYPQTEDLRRKNKTYLDVLTGSEDPGMGINNVRTSTYQVFTEINTGLQKELNNVKLESVFPNSPYAGKGGSGDFGTMNSASPFGGINMTQSIVKNYKDINMSKPNTEKTKAVNNLIEIFSNSLDDIVVVRGKLNYSGIKSKDRESSDEAFTSFKELFSSTNENVELNYYPVAVELGSSAYEITFNTKTATGFGKRTFTIYADSEKMAQSGDRFAEQEFVNTDYQALNVRGGWNFSNLDTPDVRNNKILIGDKNNITWNYEDRDGKKYTDTLPVKFNSQTTIDELGLYIKTMLELED